MATYKTKRSPGKVRAKPVKPFQYAPGSVNPYLNNPSFPGYSGDDMYDPAALPDYRYQPWYPSAFPTSTVPANSYYNPTTGAPGDTPVTSTPAMGQPSLPENYQYPYWAEKYNDAPAYAWKKNPETGDIELQPNEYAAPGAPPPEEGWTSAYSKAFYTTQSRNQPTWIGGREGGASSMGRGRRPGRYYIPEQQVKMDANGNVWAERPEYDRRSRMQKFLDKIEEDKPAGNNNMKVIQAGPNVNWRK